MNADASLFIIICEKQATTSQRTIRTRAPKRTAGGWELGTEGRLCMGCTHNKEENRTCNATKHNESDTQARIDHRQRAMQWTTVTMFQEGIFIHNQSPTAQQQPSFPPPSSTPSRTCAIGRRTSRQSVILSVCVREGARFIRISTISLVFSSGTN